MTSRIPSPMRQYRLRMFILGITLFWVSPLVAQWSTSTLAESALYVCPGFYPGIVTFDNGSSIVLGALDSYIYARKLDERGYYLWPPVQVMHHDSSYITEAPLIGDWGGWISDGDGGVILFWYDHRGAHINGPDWANNAIYVQRVDRLGVVRWAYGGVLVKGPETGIKKGGIVNDGQGGCVIAWSESEFGFPGAQGRERTRIQHISNLGVMVWERILDSSYAQHTLQYKNLLRTQERIFFTSSAGTRVLTHSGLLSTQTPIGGYAFMVSDRDSAVFVLSGETGLRILKLISMGDTVWNAQFSIRSGCEGVIPFRRGALTPDGNGGVYYLYACQDTIYHFDHLGQYTRILFPEIASQVGGYAFSDGNGGLVLANEAGIAQRYDFTGNRRWANPDFTLQTGTTATFYPGAQGTIATLQADNRHVNIYGQLNIVSELKLTGNTFRFLTGLEVSPSSTLILSPSTTLEFADGHGVLIGGSLFAEGTSNQPVLFTRTGTSGSWNGIAATNCSPLSVSTLDYARIEHAETAVRIATNSRLNLTNSVIDDAEIGIEFAPSAQQCPVAPPHINISDNHLVTPGEDDLVRVIDMRTEERYAEALQTLREIVSQRTKPGWLRRWAVRQMLAVGQQLSDVHTSSYLLGLAAQHRELDHQIRSVLPSMYLHERRRSAALAFFNKNILENPNSPLERTALYETFLDKLYVEQSTTDAASILGA